jgi:hypothetical protein
LFSPEYLPARSTEDLKTLIVEWQSEAAGQGSDKEEEEEEDDDDDDDDDEEEDDEEEEESEGLRRCSGGSDAGGA